ncbi:MAG: AAA family ATPase [Elusimicrobia bacterium]|nr:AAA family ATPase [Elusimicrobiota bacterium]
MNRIAVFGKGGIGKSTFSANLAAAYARRGLRVLLVGCDPKHDTTNALTEGAPIRTAIEHSAFMDSGKGGVEGLVVRGRLGVDCVEAGGPEPGIGCAGRGISRMIEMLEEAGYLRPGRYDAAVFDVLGDVVCGGFAAPLREGMADKIVIVTSEELMSLYAANNIARAVRNYSANGAVLAGLVANLRDPDADREAVARFAGLIGTKVLAWMDRDPAVRRAEYRRETVVESAPASGFAKAVEALADALAAEAEAPVPTPLSDERFGLLSRVGFTAAEAVPEKAASAPPPEAPRPAPAEKNGGRARVAREHERLEEELAAARPPEAGSNAEQWGGADQWRVFFCDREAKRNGRAGLELRAPVLHIWHQDLECSYASPDWGLNEPCFFNFPWTRKTSAGGAPRDEAEPGAPMPPMMMTDLRDLDVINGGEAKLREALEAGLALPMTIEAVVVNSTCVPTVIGDDVPKTLRAVANPKGTPLIFNNSANNQDVDVGRLLLDKVRAEPGFADRPKVPGSVNLVGFPEGPALGELKELLERSGVTVNAAVMPALTLELARSLSAASAQVFLPNAAYQPVYDEVFRPLASENREFDPPYGMEGTRRWLKEVAGLFGRAAAAEKAFAAAFAPWSRRWDDLRRRALDLRFAFVVDRARMARLTDARLMWGVPVLRVLREMGARVEVLLYQGEDRGPLKGFKDPAELERRLAEGRYDAVYSEYFFDERLVRAGAAQFSLAPFEPGVRGAVATLERLLAVGRWDFYRRYAEHLKGER